MTTKRHHEAPEPEVTESTGVNGNGGRSWGEWFARQGTTLRQPSVLLFMVLAFVFGDMVTFLVAKSTGYEIHVPKERPIVECIRRAIGMKEIDDKAFREAVVICIPPATDE